MALSDQEIINGIRCYTDDANPGVALTGRSALITGTFAEMVADSTAKLAAGDASGGASEGSQINVVDDHSADPTGTSDSSAAFAAAFAASDSAGGATVYIPNGVYLIQTALSHEFTADVHIRGNNARLLTDVTIDLKTNGNRLRAERLRIEPQAGGITPAISIETAATSPGNHSTQATLPILAGAEQFDVSLAGTAAAGQLTWLERDLNGSWPYRPAGTENDRWGEMQMVRSISGSTVTPHHPLFLDYAVEANPVNVWFRDATEALLSDLTVDYGTDSPTSLTQGIKLQYCANSIVRNCVVRGAGGDGIAVIRSCNVVLDGCIAVDCAHSSNGYGISIGQSSHVAVTGCNTRNCRRGVNTAASSSIPVHALAVVGGTHVGYPASSGSPVGTHAAANHVLISGCIVAGGNHSIVVRSPNTTVQGCHIHRPTQDTPAESGGMYLYGGTGCTIQNNVMHNQAYDASENTSNGDVFLRIGQPAGSPVFSGNKASALVIRGNTASVRRHFLLLDDDVVDPTRMIIEGNYAALNSDDPADACYFARFEALSVTFTNCQIVNNHCEVVQALPGSGQLFFADAVDYSGLFVTGNTGAMAAQGVSGSGWSVPGWNGVLFNASSPVTSTLPDGVVQGQSHMARCSGDQASTLAVQTHEDGNPTTYQFSASHQYALLAWTGAGWIEVKATATKAP